MGLVASCKRWAILSTSVRLRWDLLSTPAKLIKSLLSTPVKLRWDLLFTPVKLIWDFLSTVSKLGGILCTPCQKLSMEPFVRLYNINNNIINKSIIVFSAHCVTCILFDIKIHSFPYTNKNTTLYNALAFTRTIIRDSATEVFFLCLNNK